MPANDGRCICSRFAAVTEGSALAAIGWMGRGDALAATSAAREAMAVELANMPLRGRVVAGRSGDPSGDALKVGGEVGRESAPWVSSAPDGDDWTCEAPAPWDLAVDPLQAPNSLARGTGGALAMIAAGPPGSLLPVPEIYMQKIIAPPSAAGAIDLDAPVGENIRAVATALGRLPEDLVVVVLDRPRHEELIEQIRQTGSRIQLVVDGDVSAGVAVAAGDAGVDLCMGIGGSTEGILVAAALRCLGGDMQARFWPVSRHQVEMVKAAGIADIEARLSADDMVGEGVLFSVTAVTGGRFLKGIAHRADGIYTESLVLCSRCHAVRKLQTLHRSGNGGPQVHLGAR